MNNFLPDELLRLAPQSHIETPEAQQPARERPPYCDAPSLSREVERAFADRGEFWPVLRLQWHPWEHRWAVFQKKTPERLELDARFCLAGETPEQWIFCFWVGDDMGGAKPDGRLLNHLRRVNAAARGEAAAGEQAKSDLAAAQKARADAREREQRWDAIEMLGAIKDDAGAATRVSEHFILD